MCTEDYCIANTSKNKNKKQYFWSSTFYVLRPTNFNPKLYFDRYFSTNKKKLMRTQILSRVSIFVMKVSKGP